MAYQTQRLYYENNKLFSFEATVLDCIPLEKGFGVILDRTAFFPEGGGQGGDTGFLNGIPVKDTVETEQGVLHTTDAAISAGEAVRGEVNAALRLKRMGAHTGEHILSSVVHRRFGYANVGFHLGEKAMDVDFNGEFTKAQLKEIELEVNAIIRENVPVRCYYPSAEELKNIPYRSKLELESPRIVEIVGYDYCACCAPHASSTGEVGYLVILGAERNRQNVRLTVLAGEDACAYAAEVYASAQSAGALLSCKPYEVGEAVAKQMDNIEKLRKELLETRFALTKTQIESLPTTDGFIVAFTAAFALKDVLNAALEKAGRGACVFAQTEGGYTYMIASQTEDVRPLAALLNERFQGKGGGKPQSVQGRLQGEESAIRALVENYART